MIRVHFFFPCFGFLFRIVTIYLVLLVFFSSGIAHADIQWSSCGPYGLEISELAIDPWNSDTVYAGTRYNGVFKSVDGGSNWSQINNGLTHKQVLALVVDITNPNTVYVGTSGEGVFKTVDGGSTWSTAKMDNCFFE